MTDCECDSFGVCFKISGVHYNHNIPSGLKADNIIKTK